MFNGGVAGFTLSDGSSMPVYRLVILMPSSSFRTEKGAVQIDALTQ